DPKSWLGGPVHAHATTDILHRVQTRSEGRQRTLRGSVDLLAECAQPFPDVRIFGGGNAGKGEEEVHATARAGTDRSHQLVILAVHVHDAQSIVELCESRWCSVAF